MDHRPIEKKAFDCIAESTLGYHIWIFTYQGKLESQSCWYICRVYDGWLTGSRVTNLPQCPRGHPSFNPERLSSWETSPSLANTGWLVTLAGSPKGGSLCGIREARTNSTRVEHRNPAWAIALRQEKYFLKARMELRVLKFFLVFQKFLKS